MLLILQIATGSGLLVLCALIHVAVVVGAIPVLRHIGARQTGHPVKRLATILSCTVLALLFAHTLQIWLWAAFLLRIGQFADLPTSVYFTLVTYTTLGYGDIVLDPYGRTVATFAAVTGLITFGISTAVVMAVLGRIMPNFFGGFEQR